MNFKRLTCKVEETGEELVLFDGEHFQNFNRLEKLVGREYDNLNDDLMDGPSEATWGSDPFNPVHRVYKFGEAVLTLQFHYEV